MKWISRRPSRLASLGIVGALFLCHILGAFCFMIIPSAMAPTIQSLDHIEHAMAAERGCGDLLTTSSERLNAGNVLEPVCAVILTSVVPQPARGSDDLLPGPQKIGLPLYTFLSTFRI